MGQHPSVDGSASTPQAETGTVTTLRTEFSRLDLSKHLAFFYRSPQTQLRVAATFVKHGLETGHRCLYFVDTNTTAVVERAFRTAGIDVDARREAGDLYIRAGSDAYAEAEFDPDELITLLAEGCRDSVTDGYEGLFVAGELSWCFHTDLTYDHVVDFEADFDAASADLPVTALCQYDLTQFNADSVAKALWTHEQVIYRYTVCDNPYYVPPDTFRRHTDRPLDTELMLEQLHNLCRARTQVDRREQRLTVVNRVLRHNIRNDLNVVAGILELVADEASSPEQAERLDTALRHVDDLVDISEKARYVEETLGETGLTRTDLAEVVARAIDRVTDTHPDAEVAVDGAADVSVVADTHLDAALSELLQYAVRQQGADPPRVALAVVDTPPKRVSIDFSYPGSFVPATDRHVLDVGSETPLEHCDGLGLWLATWIVENASGRVVFPDDADSQLRVELSRTLS